MHEGARRRWPELVGTGGYGMFWTSAGSAWPSGGATYGSTCAVYEGPFRKTGRVWSGDARVGAPGESSISEETPFA